MARVIGKVEAVKKSWLDKKEARAWLNCSDEFLEKLMRQELVTVSVLGRKSYFELKSLENLLASNIVIRRVN